MKYPVAVAARHKESGSDKMRKKRREVRVVWPCGCGALT